MSPEIAACLTTYLLECEHPGFWITQDGRTFITTQKLTWDHDTGDFVPAGMEWCEMVDDEDNP